MQSIPLSLPVFAQRLSTAGYPAAEVGAWRAAYPEGIADLRGDTHRFGNFWSKSAALLDRLPKKPARSTTEIELANQLCRLACAVRERFLRAHVAAVYDALTSGMTRHLRVEELCYAAAGLYPGLVPRRAEVEAES